ncbi:MAG: PAC2 family protein [Candidatus Nanoarchaeia archaeon]
MNKENNGWVVNTYSKKKISSAILIEGLPGIGNVGKIVVDYIIEELKAEKIMDFFSYSLPNSVFVNEDNLVSLPRLELYYAKVNGQDYLFLAGDVQPATEDGSYSFTELILDIVEKHGCKEIITLGGIGLMEIPEKPEVYCASNDLKFIDKFIKAGAKKEVYGVVGPIMGVSGLLVGLAAKRKIKATALLAETLGHPMYLGLLGARESLNILCKVYKIKVNMKDLDKEIKLMESEDGEDKDPKLSSLQKLKRVKEMSYIG